MPCNGSTLAANTKTEKLPTSSGAAQNLTAATEEEEEEEEGEEEGTNGWRKDEKRATRSEWRSVVECGV